MSKFTDIPYYILKEYFELIADNTNPATGTMLRGPNMFAMTEGGAYTEAFVKIDDEYLKIKLLLNSPVIDDNFFNFILHSVESMIVDPPSAGTFLSGSEIFLREDSYFHTWYKKKTEDESYINTEKFFTYLGKIYNRFSSTDEEYAIEFYGIKDFATNALPVHQQTDKIKQLNYLFFDKIYTEIYNRAKDLFSLLDPMEIDINWLWYFAKMYYITLNDSLSNDRKREFARDIVHFLKRKGTFTSVYIIWYLLALGTLNRLNIYERWHPKNISGDPTNYFQDHLYQSYYDSSIDMNENTTAGEKFYNYYYNKSNYPNPLAEVIDQYTMLINHGLNSENLIIQIYDENYEKVYPISITFIDSNNCLVETSGLENKKYFLAGIADYTETISGTQFTIHHNLNVDDILIQCTDSLTKKILVPNIITKVNNNNVILSFSSAVNVKVCIASANNAGQFISTTDSTFTHNLDSDAILADTWAWSISGSTTASSSASPSGAGSSLIRMDPLTIDCIDKNNVNILFDSAQSGRLAMLKPDFMTEFTENSLILTPHYRVELDLSGDILEYNYTNTSNNKVIGEDLITDLRYNWELIRPINRYSHFNYLLRLNSDLSGNPIATYQSPYENESTTKYTKAETNIGAITGSYIFQQLTKSSTWTIDHMLDSNDIIIQCFNENFKLLNPSDIITTSRNRTTISFSEPEAGWAFLLKSNYNIYAISNIIEHNLGSFNIIVQCIDENGENIDLHDIELLTINTCKLITDDVGEFKTVIKEGDYTENKTGEQFTITHGLGTTNVLVQCYDAVTNHWVTPSVIKYTSNNDVYIRFDTYKNVNVNIAIGEDNQTFSGVSTTTLNHGFNKEAAITQVYRSDSPSTSGSIFTPLSIINIDENNTKATFSTTETGNIICGDPDFIEEINSWTIEHLIGNKYVISQYDSIDVDRAKFTPRNVLLDDLNTIEASLTEPVSGYALVEEIDYRYEIPTAESTWVMQHNLGFFANIVQFFDSDDNEIFPNTYSIVDKNLCVAVFDDDISGYAIFKSIGNINFDAENMASLENGTFKLGSGNTFDWNPDNGIENIEYTGNITEFRSDSDYYYIYISDSVGKEINITEIGLYGDTGDLIFYTKTRPIFKQSDIELKLFYKIRR